MAIDPYAVLDVGGMKFAEPDFHVRNPSFMYDNYYLDLFILFVADVYVYGYFYARTLIFRMSGSSGPVMEHPLIFAYSM